MKDRDAARKALDQYSNYEKAADALCKWASRDDLLREDLIRRGASAALYEIANGDRTRARVVIAANRDDPSGLIASGNDALYEWRLYGGQLMGDADNAALLMSANRHDAHGQTHLKHAWFERSVARLVKGTQKVRDIVDHDRLKTLLAGADRKFGESNAA